VNHWLLIMPIGVPLATGLLTLAARRSVRLQRSLSVGGAAALLVSGVALLAAVWSGGVLATHVGGLPQPFGIILAADLLSALMVVLAGLMGLAVAIYSLSDLDVERERFGYHTLFHLLLMGVCGAFVTTDLFNLYVWFEVMLMASFVLLALGGRRAQLEGALKYVTLNLVASALLLAAVGLTYGVVGSLNMAEIALAFRRDELAGQAAVIGVLFLVAFGIKAAVFPLFGWLPASYHTPAVAVSALFAGLLTKVGVYALIRVSTLVYGGGSSQDLLLVIGGLTMLTGVLGAAAQTEIRRILSFHIVSQIGYMVLGLGLLTPLGIAGAVFYLAHHIVVKTNLFLVGGVVQRLEGSSTLSRIGGLYARVPWVAVLFLIPALSLAGVPPLSGFWAKYMVIDAALDAGEWILAATALLVGLLTVYSMTKIWGQAFWSPRPADAPEPPQPLTRRDWWSLAGPAAALASITVLIGLVAQPLAELSQAAAQQLLDPVDYIAAILGGGGE
jgi:multicomponent Na+:H+ antiporter subunit D